MAVWRKTQQFHGFWRGTYKLGMTDTFVERHRVRNDRNSDHFHTTTACCKLTYSAQTVHHSKTSIVQTSVSLVNKYQISPDCSISDPYKLHRPAPWLSPKPGMTFLLSWMPMVVLSESSSSHQLCPTTLMPNFQALCASGKDSIRFINCKILIACGVYSEIYQVTGPVERFAGQIASQGYVVGQWNHGVDYGIWTEVVFSACPSIYHEFEGPEAIPYDVEGEL